MAKWVENTEYEHFVFDLVTDDWCGDFNSVPGYVSHSADGWIAWFRSTEGWQRLGNYARLNEARKAVEQATGLVADPLNPPAVTFAPDASEGFPEGESHRLAGRPGTGNSIYFEYLFRKARGENVVLLDPKGDGTDIGPDYTNYEPSTEHARSLIDGPRPEPYQIPDGETTY